MKKLATAGCLSVICATMFTGCSVELTHDSTSIKKVSDVKLANGNAARVGWMPVSPEWHCRQVDKQSGTVFMNQLKGSLTFSGAYQEMENQAVEYANKNNLKTNYIYLYSPHQTAINGFNLSMFSESSATFYQCKILPAVKTSLF